MGWFYGFKLHLIVNEHGELVALYVTQLKNISQIAHTRHRNVDNFMVSLMAGLIAYTWQPRKPSLNLLNEDAPFLPVLI